MSYHAKKSAGQKSTGLILVVAFHIILIWGLANGLAHRISDKLPEILQTKVVEEEKKVDEIEPPPPPPPEKAPPPDFVPPPEVSFVTEAPKQAITVQQNKPVAAPPPPAAVTKAKPAKALTPPTYPQSSIKLGEEGVTGMNLYIDENGKVVDAKVASSSGSEKLDNAALEHAKRSWKFIPCMEGDKPKACWLPINFKWQLKDAK